MLKTEETGIAIKIREEYTYRLNINVEEENQIISVADVLSDIPIIGLIFKFLSFLFKLLLAPFGFLVSGEASIPLGDTEEIADEEETETSLEAEKTE